MATETTCSTCEIGYQVDTGICVHWPDHCIRYDGKCTSCSDGYYLDDFNDACIECTNVNAKYLKLDCEGEKRVDFPWKCVDLTLNC